MFSTRRTLAAAALSSRTIAGAQPGVEEKDDTQTLKLDPFKQLHPPGSLACRSSTPHTWALIRSSSNGNSAVCLGEDLRPARWRLAGSRCTTLSMCGGSRSRTDAGWRGGPNADRPMVASSWSPLCPRRAAPASGTGRSRFSWRSTSQASPPIIPRSVLLDDVDEIRQLRPQEREQLAGR